MYKTIVEGKAKILIPKEEKISKKLPVFYNTIMEFNRTTSVLLINSLDKKEMQIASILAGTGIRSIRFLLELNEGVIKKICINDMSTKAFDIIKENLKINNLDSDTRVEVYNKDANLFMLESTGFDYIDIDPFGSPNDFLFCAIQRLARDGILAVTATDTSALCGTHPEACRRKYWAEPLRDERMHETGLRILIRKVQLIGAENEKALTPIYSYSKDHYMRVFFYCKKGKKEVDKIINKIGMIDKSGPMWLGQLWDNEVAGKIAKLSEDEIYKVIAQESEINAVGFYSTPMIAKKHKIHNLPRQEKIIEDIKKKGYNASRTHFDMNGFRTDMPEEELIKLIKGISKLI